MHACNRAHGDMMFTVNSAKWQVVKVFIELLLYYISLIRFINLTLEFSQDWDIMASKYFSGIRHFSYGQKGSRDKVSTATIDERGKMVGLYYSAYWCPPCIEITKKVVRWYEKIQGSSDVAKNLEIVFVSFDRDEDEYNRHFDKMPWLAVPYEERKTCVSKTIESMQLRLCFRF